jgi:hypothetical protein
MASLECGGLESVSKPDIVNNIRFAGSAGVSPARAHGKSRAQNETYFKK